MSPFATPLLQAIICCTCQAQSKQLWAAIYSKFFEHHKRWGEIAILGCVRVEWSATVQFLASTCLSKCSKSFDCYQWFRLLRASSLTGLPSAGSVGCQFTMFNNNNSNGSLYMIGSSLALEWGYPSALQCVCPSFPFPSTYGSVSISVSVIISSPSNESSSWLVPGPSSIVAVAWYNQ